MKYIFSGKTIKLVYTFYNPFTPSSIFNDGVLNVGVIIFYV